MNYIACKALNWGNNDFPIGELGYCVVFVSDGKTTSIKWFPELMFNELFGGKMNGTF